MADQTLAWRRCMDANERPQWCSLLRLDTASVTAEHGVYVTIGEQLARLREDQRLLAYADHGLFVTWAEVSDADLLDGVERYLGDQLVPLEGRLPDAPPLPVNLPWDEGEDD